MGVEGGGAFFLSRARRRGAAVLSFYRTLGCKGGDAYGGEGSGDAYGARAGGGAFFLFCKTSASVTRSGFRKGARSVEGGLLRGNFFLILTLFDN